MPNSTAKQLCIAYVAIDGGRDYVVCALRERDDRLRDLVATVAALADANIDLLVFPAGYFQVRDAGMQRRLVTRVANELSQVAPRFCVIFGVDRRFGSSKRMTKESGGEPPFFAFHWSPSGAVAPMWQVSVTRDEGTRDVVDARWCDRNLLLPGTDIAFLICGEIWSDELLERVANSDCRALVIAAHRNVNLHRKKEGYGKLSWHRRLDAFSRKHDVAIVLAEHTRSPKRHPYAWPRSISTPLKRDGVPASVTLRLAFV